jgi:hypothetical protein
MGNGNKSNQTIPTQLRPVTYTTYNNFNDLNASMITSPGINSLNQSSIVQPLQPRFEQMDEDEVGEFIYNFVERIYPRYKDLFYI